MKTVGVLVLCVFLMIFALSFHEKKSKKLARVEGDIVLAEVIDSKRKESYVIQKKFKWHINMMGDDEFELRCYYGFFRDSIVYISSENKWLLQEN